MKINSLLFFIFIFPLFSEAKSITLSRGHDAFVQSFSESVLQKAYQNLGIKLDIIHVPVGRSLLLANSGEVDGEVSRIKKVASDYTNLIRIPVPINYVDIRMFTYNKKLLSHDQGISRFYRIGCIKGVVLSEKIIKQLNETCHTVTGFKQAIGLLNKNKIDVLILPLTVGLYFKDTDLQFSSSYYGKTLGTEPLYHYLHKKHFELVPKLTEQLKSMNINFKKQTFKNDKSSG